MVPSVSFRSRLIGCVCLCMLTASASLADDPAESATSKFFGARADQASVSFVLQQASPLFGGREFYVSGDGHIVIVDIRRRASQKIVERRFEIEDASKEAGTLIDMIRKADLFGVPLENPIVPRATCSLPPLFILRNGAGDVRALPMIKGAPTKAYEDVCMAVAALMKLTREIEPVYEGDYDATYSPRHFDWTKPILAPCKDIRWAPSATSAEIQKAEEEYLKKVDIQLKELEARKLKDAEKGEPPAETPKPDADHDTPPSGKNDDQ